MVRRCKVCGIEKFRCEFYPKNLALAPKGPCRECVIARATQRNRTNPNRAAIMARYRRNAKLVSPGRSSTL
jgi:hypothetical protein